MLDVVVEEPITILGECGGVPDRVIGAETHKPAEQSFAAELLQQPPLGADPMRRLQ